MPETDQGMAQFCQSPCRKLQGKWFTGISFSRISADASLERSLVIPNPGNATPVITQSAPADERVSVAAISIAFVST